MVMTTITPARVAPRSWADIVKKGTTEADRVEDAALGSDASPKLAEVTTSDDDLADWKDFCPSLVDAPTEQSSEPTVEAAAEEQVEPTVSQETVLAGPPGILTKETVPAAPKTSTSLVPGARGDLQCFCHGKVLSMLSHYGWLEVFGEVEHPLAAKHFGRIYVQRKDVVDGYALQAGDCVSLYLYVDNVGLGAEECRVEGASAAAATSTEAPKLRAEAAEFVPGGAYQSSSATQAPVADVFARISRTFNSIPANGYVEMSGVFNSAFFDDLTDSEDSDEGNADADKESLHDESEDSSLDTVEEVKVLAASAPWKKKTSRSHTTPNVGKVERKLSSDCYSTGMTSDSTNAGTTSDSDSESRMLCKMISVPRGLRPPPGLEDIVPIVPDMISIC